MLKRAGVHPTNQTYRVAESITTTTRTRLRSELRRVRRLGAGEEEAGDFFAGGVAGFGGFAGGGFAEGEGVEGEGGEVGVGAPGIDWMLDYG